MIHLRTYMTGKIGEIVVPIVVSTTTHDPLAISRGHRYATAIFLGRDTKDDIANFEFDEEPYSGHFKIVGYCERQGFRKLKSEVDSGISLVA